MPARLDTRPVISFGKGQCLSEAEEVPRAKAKPSAFPPGFTQALTFPEGYKGLLTSRWAGIQLTYAMLRLF